MRATTIALFLFICATASSQVKFKIREYSLVAKIAARLHGTDTYAMTIGGTIYISCSESDFYKRPAWVYHELTHICQYKRLGTLEFLKRYIFCMVFVWKHDLIPLEREANYNEDNMIIPK